MSKQLNVRSDRDWQTLCAEFNICKRRLKSKEEGLLILSKELDTIRRERDEYKLMAEQLREKYHGQKRKYEERERALGLWSPDNDHVAERRSQSLAQLLCEARERNKKLHLEADELKQSLAEAHGDIKLLRENIARQRVGDEGIGGRNFPAHERAELVKQIEELRQQAVSLERELTGKLDDEEEILLEKEHFRLKAERLNQELNYILGGDEKRIVDIDALSMEKEYLKERLKQCQEERDLANQMLTKYKNALDKRRGKGTLKLGGNRTGGVVISQKQVQQLLAEGKGTGIAATPSSVADLQALASALLETISDKTLALNHQRNTNKILGKRVAELEKKLKTLEVSGFWNLPPNLLRGKVLESVMAEDAEMKSGIKALTPKQAPSSDDNATPPSSTHASPTHQTKSSDSESLISVDLDLLSPQDDTSSMSDVTDSHQSDRSEKQLASTDLEELLHATLSETHHLEELNGFKNGVPESVPLRDGDITDDQGKGQSVSEPLGAHDDGESDTEPTGESSVQASMEASDHERKEDTCVMNGPDDTDIIVAEERPGSNPFEDESGPNPFEEESGLNPFDEEPGSNPFEEEPESLEVTPTSNPFEETPGANPFDEPPGSNPFDEAPQSDTDGDTESAELLGEICDVSGSQESDKAVSEFIEDIFEDVASKLSVHQANAAASSSVDNKEPSGPSSALLNKKAPPPPPPPRDVEV
ncbi:coiled-coil domain-containing protein 149-B-like [Ptychodera flava]|uniref:coiled-coil domain-containing protein 149-B-like n=1 Tax=Ptychodera flava TaxID=63121 RepID=UPI00396A5A69